MGEIASARNTLSFSQGILLLAFVTGGILLAGLVVIAGRKLLGGGDAASQSESVVRSWIAISLVIGLLIFCAAAFLINDSSLRSTLLGGLVASVGAAIAFYFSSKSAEQARADALKSAGDARTDVLASADQARTDVLAAIGHGVAKPTQFSHATPPAATVGTPYVYRLLANGQPAPTYVLAEASALPPGVELHPDGTLYGAPTTPGAVTFTVVASNSLGSLTSDPLTITVS